MLTFISTYLLLIFVGSFFCCGWYVITRSAEYIMPDGKKEYEEMIFGFWQRFFEKSLGYKKVHYRGEQLNEKLQTLYQYIPSFEKRLKMNPEGYSLLLVGEDLTRDEKKKIEDLLNVIVGYNGNIFIYNNFVIYRFPSWVRKPLSSCPPCMASIYGSVVYFVFSDVLNMFDSFKIQVILWLPFCVAVALVNKIITEKYHL